MTDMTDKDRAELEALRAEKAGKNADPQPGLSDSERAELEALRAGQAQPGGPPAPYRTEDQKIEDARLETEARASVLARRGHDLDAIPADPGPSDGPGHDGTDSTARKGDEL